MSVMACRSSMYTMLAKNNSVCARRKYTKGEVPKKNVTHLYWLKENYS